LKVLQRVCFRGSFEFELFFTFSLVCLFSCHLLVLQFFLLLDDLLEFFLAFGLLVVLHVVLDSKFKLCVIVLSIYSSRGRLRNQAVSILV
jgi:hypothetical protein